MLHGSGYRNCAFRAHDLTAGEPVPGGPFDLVYARLLLIHLPGRAAVLARLWDAVAPGGYLVVQDYDAAAFGVLPELPSFAELTRVIMATFHATGADVRTGALLTQLFVQAGAGIPDGTDVTGRVEPLGAGGRVYAENVYRSLLPAALAYGITTEDDSAAMLAELAWDTARFASSPPGALAPDDRRLEAQGTGLTLPAPPALPSTAHVKREHAASAARPWASAECRRCAPNAHTVCARPLCVRGYRDTPIHIATR